jgi:hypothetical protein
MTDLYTLRRACELRYLDGLSRQEIAFELSPNKQKPYDPSRVNQWLDEAKERGIIAFDIDVSFATRGTLDTSLARELQRAFNLEQSIVVNVGDAAPALEGRSAPDLHQALANQTGMRLSAITSANSTFFLAGGRTVVQIARMMKRMPPIAASNRIRIYPLSGRNWTGVWQVDGPDDLERPLDADDAAVILASAFPESGTRFSQIGYPLYAETRDQAHAIMRDHCAFLPDGGWNWDIPQLKNLRAICGIGVLRSQSGHRIMRFLETYLQGHGVKDLQDFEKRVQDGIFGAIKSKLPKKPDRSAAYLSRVALELIDAITLATEKNLGHFGDVANRLYPCLPLPNELSVDNLPAHKSYEELIARLDALNQRAIIMQWSHLRNLSTWITAGGELKRRPLWTLAIMRYIDRHERNSSSESVMTHLTTDSVTAQYLLKALEGYKQAPPQIKSWYLDLSELLLRDDARTVKQRAS